MTLRYKFALPINLMLLLVLGTSLAWEWRRQEATGMALLRARLNEEARFVQAAYHSFGMSPRFVDFLQAFCHASDISASPEHQVALVDGTGVVAGAAEHARRPMDPVRLAALGEGVWTRQEGGESFLVGVLGKGAERVVVAESTRAVAERVRANLKIQAVWFIGAGVLLFGAINFVMGRAVLRPIRRIARAVRDLERGQLGVEVATPNGDELGSLARQFNAMSRALADQAEDERREMETARQVQSELLPPERVRLGMLELAGRCLQAGPVGGDVYDVRLLPGGRIGLLVADLSGHNIAAALHTAMVRAIVWREAEQATSPAEVLSRLNDQLCRNLPDGHFATVFFGWFEPENERLRFANAGHPPALLRDASGGISELGTTMPLLGVIADLPGAEVAVEFGPDNRLLVFSDGLTEAANPQGILWGAEGLSASLEADNEPDALVTAVLERAAEFRGGGAPQDDVTIVLAAYEPVLSASPIGKHVSANTRGQLANS
ncbi:SpoIIE family protein phosphatase [Singulisphaera sp. Ch08]|uniref:SpoIIE family protein phosphatase n=1 Tax=Singulisphaera sp. Ch08 TaxID=3120278 RepID=A0AAU7CTC7_9BACT